MLLPLKGYRKLIVAFLRKFFIPRASDEYFDTSTCVVMLCCLSLFVYIKQFDHHNPSKSKDVQTLRGWNLHFMLTIVRG